MKRYCDAVAASEGFVTDAGEAIGQAGQREGGALQEGRAANEGESVGEAGQRDGGAILEGWCTHRC